MILELFCFHEDFLIYSHNLKEKAKILKNTAKKYSEDIEHHFINCDCFRNENNECYYNEFITDNKWKKINKEKFQDEEKKEENNIKLNEIKTYEKKETIPIHPIPFKEQIVAGAIGLKNPLLGLQLFVSKILLIL